MIDGVGCYKAPGMDDYEPICHGGGGSKSPYFKIPYPEGWENDPDFRRPSFPIVSAFSNNMGYGMYRNFQYKFDRDYPVIFVIGPAVDIKTSATRGIKAPFKFIVNDIIKEPMFTHIRNYKNSYDAGYCVYAFSDIKKDDILETYGARDNKTGYNWINVIHSIEYDGPLLTKAEKIEYEPANEIVIEKDYKVISVFIEYSGVDKPYDITCNDPTNKHIPYDYVNQPNGLNYMIDSTIDRTFSNIKKGDTIYLLSGTRVDGIFTWIPFTSVSSISSIKVYGIN